jgi:hypothetical protein
MTPIHWLDRLRRYLAPLRGNDLVEIWDDSRIGAGSDWRAEIDTALQRATAAILLVGPDFLASDFIASKELPVLLDASKRRGTKLYPLVVGYCGYTRSVLEPYQAFNDPNVPLEALSTADQNKVLNDISMAVDEALRHAQPVVAQGPVRISDTHAAMKEIAENLDNAQTAFIAQARRRDALVATIRKRLGVGEVLQYEKFFFRFYDELDRMERFEFDQIRAMTEGPLYEGNKRILQIMERHPEVLDELPVLADLRQHLVFWLNKYEKMFLKRPEMCLLYTGVEDGVPFPDKAHRQVDQWLAKHKA